jgi:hypothetical protein
VRRLGWLQPAEALIKKLSSPQTVKKLKTGPPAGFAFCSTKTVIANPAIKRPVPAFASSHPLPTCATMTISLQFINLYRHYTTRIKQSQA